MTFLKEDIINFLKEVDENIENMHKVPVYIMGGAAMLLGYGSERSTRDIDLILTDECKSLLKLAGRDSPLSKRHKGLYLDTPAPGQYRISEKFEKYAIIYEKNIFKKLEIYILDPYDIILTKISRLEDKDILDIIHLFKKNRLSMEKLERKFKKSLTTFSEKTDDYHFDVIKKIIRESV
jgi:hypothetical protein